MSTSPPETAMSTQRVCPACCTRHAGLVDPGCVVCDGAGVLTLGPAALSMYDPPVVSQAAAVALEAVARTTDLATTLSDDRTKAIRSTITDLVTAGVLAQPVRPPRKPTVLPRRRDTAGRYTFETTPTDLAAECVQETILPVDEALIESEPYVYAETDRPNARGLPLLSANGHPSHLARIADPEDPGNDTRATVRHRKRELDHARVLLEAVPEVIRKKLAKQKRAAA